MKAHPQNKSDEQMRTHTPWKNGSQKFQFYSQLSCYPHCELHKIISSCLPDGETDRHLCNMNLNI